MNRCTPNLLQRILGIPNVEAVTKPSNPSVSSDSINFDFKTEVPIVPGTEQYYKYLVQYRVRDSEDWRESPPLMDHPDGVTTRRYVLSHTINNLEPDIEYEVQVAVCRVWYGVRGECSWAPNPVVSITTSKQTTSTWKLLICRFYYFLV